MGNVLFYSSTVVPHYDDTNYSDDPENMINLIDGFQFVWMSTMAIEYFVPWPSLLSGASVSYFAYDMLSAGLFLFLQYLTNFRRELL